MPELPCSHIHPVQGKLSLPKVGRVLDSRKIIPEKKFLEIMGQRAVGNNSKRKIQFSHCEDGVQDVKYKNVNFCVFVFVISIFLAVRSALCTSLSSLVQNMRYSAICSQGAFLAFLGETFSRMF